MNLMITYLKNLVNNWNKNPFTLGAYSGAISDKANLRPRLISAV